MLRIVLTEEDRDALGAPEVIEYDMSRPRLKETRALKRQVGLTFAELGQQLKAGGIEATGALVWMALLAAGVAVSWEDFDLDLIGTDISLVEDPKA